MKKYTVTTVYKPQKKKKQKKHKKVWRQYAKWSNLRPTVISPYKYKLFIKPVSNNFTSLSSCSASGVSMRLSDSIMVSGLVMASAYEFMSQQRVCKK